MENIYLITSWFYSISINILHRICACNTCICRTIFTCNQCLLIVNPPNIRFLLLIPISKTNLRDDGDLNENSYSCNIFYALLHRKRPGSTPITNLLRTSFWFSGLSKQLWGRWFETPSCPLRRHCNSHTVCTCDVMYSKGNTLASFQYFGKMAYRTQ